MAIVAFSITKQMAFRDSIQEFSNVYYYWVLVTPNETEAINRINELVTFEKSCHANSITYNRGRCWLAGGTASQNVMIADIFLSGTGSLSVNATMDKERAILCQWPAGTDSRNRQVYLRKWWHACASFGGVSITANHLVQATGFTSGERASIAAKADEITQIGGASEYSLCGPTGRATTGNVAAHPYLEHRQLGDQWRGS